MSLNPLDIIILLPILIGLVRGVMRGLITELIAILAVVLGVIGTRLWGPLFMSWVQLQAPAWSPQVCQLLAYALLFIGIAIACNMVGRLLGRLIRAIHLGWLNRVMGAIFGAAKWLLILLTLVYLLNLLNLQFNFLQSIEVFQTSILYPHFTTLSSTLYSTLTSL